jgi:hypothetical protein
MTQMIRKQVYIEPKQDAILKKRARRLGITEAEVIRRAIDRHTVLMPSVTPDLAAWEREKAYISKRMAAGRVRSDRRFYREDAYKQRLKRYGK